MDPFQFAAVNVAHLLCLGVVEVDPLGAFFQEMLIIAPVRVDLAAVELHHRIADTVEEIAVVRHHKKSAAAVPEIPLEEFDGIDVEVVRGLVHNIEIGL